MDIVLSDVTDGIIDLFARYKGIDRLNLYVDLIEWTTEQFELFNEYEY